MTNSRKQQTANALVTINRMFIQAINKEYRATRNEYSAIGGFSPEDEFENGLTGADFIAAIEAMDEVEELLSFENGDMYSKIYRAI